jgi:hypothetical protein
MTKTELEFKVNDVFDVVAHLPAVVKLIAIADLVLASGSIAMIFGEPFLRILTVVLALLLGWWFGTEME